jgi:hypothetical protein
MLLLSSRSWQAHGPALQVHIKTNRNIDSSDKFNTGVIDNDEPLIPGVIDQEVFSKWPQIEAKITEGLRLIHKNSWDR